MITRITILTRFSKVLSSIGQCGRTSSGMCFRLYPASEAVHFDAAPVIIPDDPEEEKEEHQPPWRFQRPHYDYEREPERVPEPTRPAAARDSHDDDEGDAAVALYNFAADGDSSEGPWFGRCCSC